LTPERNTVFVPRMQCREITTELLVSFLNWHLSDWTKQKLLIEHIKNTITPSSLMYLVVYEQTLNSNVFSRAHPEYEWEGLIKFA
jgi:hypothetical protein